MNMEKFICYRRGIGCWSIRHLSVEIADEAGNDIHMRCSGKACEMQRQLVGRPEVIAIQEADELAAGDPQTDISSWPRAARRPVEDTDRGETRGQGLDDLTRAVGRAVVDHQDFMHRPRLGEHGFQRVGDVFLAVSHRHDDADRWGVAHALSSRTNPRSTVAASIGSLPIRNSWHGSERDRLAACWNISL